LTGWTIHVSSDSIPCQRTDYSTKCCGSNITFTFSELVPHNRTSKTAD
jgi:hypothetical protein